jgi:CelD/BcsL family acetyltransferase involved in cellulose biosynthesis
MVREGKKPIILVAYDNDIIVGFSSFQIVNTTFRILEGFAQEFCDFVDWLCVPGMEDVVGKAFCQWLSAQKKSYDLIRYYNILPDGVCAQAIRKYSPEMLHEHSVAPHVTMMATSYDAYINSLKKKFVSDTRRRQRKLEREHGGLDYFVVQSEKDIPDLIELVAEWLRGRRHEKNGSSYLDRYKMKEHITELYIKLFQLDMLHFSGIAINNKVIALNIAFKYANGLFSYTPVFDRVYYKYAVIRLLKLRHLEECYQQGYYKYDFCLGGESYKFNFLPITKQLFKYNSYGHTLTGFSLQIMDSIVKPMIKRMKID